MSDDLGALREELRKLTDRVVALESHPHPPENAEAAGEDTFWALNGLKSRIDAEPTMSDGAVMIVGSLTLPTGTPVSWQQGADTADLLDTEWTDRAGVFSALGHPVRLELLRHILSGVQATSDLAAIDSLGTTGQLHHHLRQLVAAGWVRQRGRGSYEVPAARVVPLLTSLLGAER